MWTIFTTYTRAYWELRFRECPFFTLKDGILKQKYKPSLSAFPMPKSYVTSFSLKLVANTVLTTNARIFYNKIKTKSYQQTTSTNWVKRLSRCCQDSRNQFGHEWHSYANVHMHTYRLKHKHTRTHTHTHTHTHGMHAWRMLYIHLNASRCMHACGYALHTDISMHLDACMHGGMHYIQTFERI